MNDSRVFLVGEDATVLADALERRGFAVETVTDGRFAFDALGGGVASVVVDYDTTTAEDSELVSRLRDHVGATPVYLLVDDADYTTPAVVDGGAIGIDRKRATEETDALAARIERAIEFSEWAASGRQGDSLYRTIVEQSHDAIFAGQNGDFQFWNHRLAELTGCSDDELAEKAVLDVIHPDDRAIVGEISKSRRRGEGAPESYDVRIVDADGEMRVCSANVQDIEYHGEYGVLVTMRDMTEQRTYENHLQRYETMVESIQQGAHVVDEELVIQYINEVAVDRFALSRDELVGKHVSVTRDRGLLDDEQYTHVESVLEDILAGESDGERFELEVSFSTGAYVIEFDVTPIVDDDGTVTGAVGLSSDITERKQYEERLNALHASTRRLSAATTDEEVADVVCDAAVEVLEYDLCGVLLYDESLDALVPTKFTEQAEGVFGEIPTLSRGTGLSWEVFESDQIRLYGEVESDPRRYNPGTDIVEELIVPIPDYGVFFVGALAEGALADQRVALAKVLASNTRAALDRVEREQLLRRREAELARQNEQLESFASAVSHDLQNPLNVAAGYLELARERHDSDELERVARAHDRMDAIIQDVLALARSGQTVDDVERLSLESVAGAAWETAAVDAPDATLEVTGDTQVTAHRGRLRQLLENLVANAIRHGGGDVTVRVGPLEDRDGFYVEDDGPGVPPEDRPRIFEAGYTTNEDGTGFGLSVVQSVVNAHGWSVCFSDADGGGARFEITTQSEA